MKSEPSAQKVRKTKKMVDDKKFGFAQKLSRSTRCILDQKWSRSDANALVALTLSALLLVGSAGAVEVSPFEGEPIAPSVAPIDDALTLARVLSGGQQEVIVVTKFDFDTVEGVPVSALGLSGIIDPIDAGAELLARIDLAQELDDAVETATYAMTDVLPAAGESERNIGIGTNFPEHQEEATMNDVFIFPKFGPPNPPRTTVEVDTAEELLDYEVEFCARFDRTLQTIEDFDEATIGFFLCADFTDRADLMRYIDLENPYSGIGFTDGKSGPDYFPTGPFLVIPRDWRSFIADERMVTYVDQEQRQDARGAEMILDHRQLIKMALEDSGEPTFRLAREPVTLMEGRAVKKGVNLMSGTSEGVVFRPPTEEVIGEAIASAKKDGGDPQEHLAQILVQRDLVPRDFLQPGQRVTYKSSHLGEIAIDVVAAQR